MAVFFWLFLVCNTALFSLSTSIIVLLIQNLAIFLLLSIILCSSYLYSVWTIIGAPNMMIPLGFLLVTEFALIQLFSFFHNSKEWLDSVQYRSSTQSRDSHCFGRNPFSDIQRLIYSTCTFVLFSYSVIVLLIPAGYVNFFEINAYFLWFCYFPSLRLQIGQLFQFFFQPWFLQSY